MKYHINTKMCDFPLKKKAGHWWRKIKKQNKNNVPPLKLLINAVKYTLLEQ